MINFRVDDLDGILGHLRSLGDNVDENIMDQGYGRFGWVVDPEGNRVELWEPVPSE
jgi:predicted enzyme related to lactoylglutathione lyase